NSPRTWYRPAGLHPGGRAPAYSASGDTDPAMAGFSGRDPLGVMRAYVPDLRAVTMLPGAGHLLPLERGDEVNAAIVGHLHDLG
ncbi:alpha/beta fold hydrolase, partial [Nocardia farcinica]|uniref:alpha/beta fold hydrolase n=1 Tax=Nocardia farcinica TaxID=37329 RepID=UPI003D7AD4E7